MHAWSLPWTFFSGRLPIFNSLSSFFFFFLFLPLQLVLLRFNLVPSSGACSSGISFCLSCCLYFYASGMWVVFLNVGEMAFYRRCPVHPSSAHPSCRPSCMLWGLPPWGLCGSFCCGRLCGRFDRLGWPWSVYLPGTSLYRGCWLLVSGAWSQGSWLRNSRGPGARAGSLVCGLKTRRLWGCGPPTGSKASSWG